MEKCPLKFCNFSCLFSCYIIIIYQNICMLFWYLNLIYIYIFPISCKTTITVFLLFAINYGRHMGVVYLPINGHWNCYDQTLLLFDAFLFRIMTKLAIISNFLSYGHVTETYKSRLVNEAKMAQAQLVLNGWDIDSGKVVALR